MSVETISLSPRTPAYNAVDVSGAEGALIEELRERSGYVMRGIDWVCRQLGFDLLGSIYDPLLGGYSTIDSMAAAWGATGDALDLISQNYGDMARALPDAWLGAAAENCRSNLVQTTQALADQGEGSRLVASSIRNMMEAVRVAVEFIAEIISLVDELVLSMTIAKVAKEVATFGATVRKVAGLVKQAIDMIQDLRRIIPQLLQAVAALSAVMKAVNLVLRFSEVGVHAGAGMMVDDVAAAAT